MLKMVLMRASKVKAVAKNGTVAVEDSLLIVRNADALTLYISGSTNYPGFKNLIQGIESLPGDPETACAAMIARAETKAYEKIKKDHIADHQQFYNRVSLDLGEVSKDREEARERYRHGMIAWC